MANGCEDKKRLRRFLMTHLDAGDVPGLWWRDRSAGLFRIGWPHAGRSGFNSDQDGLIFKLWAKETDKWKPGEPEDWGRWKTRVRNALYKLKDYEEQPELGKPNDLHDPFKVYKLVPPPKDPPPANDIGLSAEVTMDYLNDLDELLKTQPSTGEAGVGACAPGQPITLNVPFDNNVQTSDQSMSSSQGFGTISPMQLGTTDPNRGARAVVPPFTANVPTDNYALSADQSTASLQKEFLGPFSNFQDCEVQISIMYLGTTVFEGTYTTPTGFRIFYGSPAQHLAGQQSGEIFTKLFGPENVTQVLLPECEQFIQSPKQLRATRKLLDRAKRGVVFQFWDGNIWATRLCETTVYWHDPNLPNMPLPKKLERDTLTKVFDLLEFLRVLEEYIRGGSRRPRPYFKLCIGQTWSTEDPFEKNLVTVMVHQKTAAENLETVRQQQGNKSLSINLSKDGAFSNPTEDDRLVATLEQLIASLSLQQASAPPPLNTTGW